MDGIAATMVFLLFISLSSVGTTRAEMDIPLGSSLYPTTHPTYWNSPSGLFAFGFYHQVGGFAVGIWWVGQSSTTVVWTANRDDPPLTSNAKLQLTLDGKVVLQTEQGQEKLIANANKTAYSASMLDSGNFVLYNKDSSVIWQSFDYPTNTLLGNQTLRHGGQLVSSSSSETNRSTGRFHLKMQHDGNLVLYPLNTDDSPVDAYWASDTCCINGFKFHLYLNKTGILVIRNGSDLNLNAIKYLYDSSSANNNNNNEKQTIYRATLDYDGFFRLYVHDDDGSGIKVVASWPDRKDACSLLKGLCGFNSYCDFDDDHQPYCNCLPGFDFIDPKQASQGCKRNASEAECTGERDNGTFYSMVPMKNMVWGDLPYLQAKMSQQEECSSSCLANCNCEAALYWKGFCMKQNSPFRYVRMTRDAEPNSTLFLKVGNKSLKNWALNKTPPIMSISKKAIVQVILVTSGFTLLLCSAVAVSSHFIHNIRVLRYKRLLEIGDLGLNEELTY